MATHQNTDTFLDPTQGGRTNPTVLVSENGTYRPHIVIGDPKCRYNLVTIQAERVTLNKKSLVLAAGGNVTIQDDKQRGEANVHRGKFQDIITTMSRKEDSYA